MQREERTLYYIMCILLAGMFLTALFMEGPATLAQRMLTLQQTSARLIHDFSAYGSAVALLNAASVALLGLILVYYAAISLSGPTLACILTMMGFSFFGNTLFNSLPIIAGVWFASKLARQTFGSYSIIALFGTALGPLVTHVAFALELPLFASIPLGIAAGVLTGLLLPALASALLRLHQGYNLYNIGFTCGFLGLFWASLLSAFGLLGDAPFRWEESSALALQLLVPLFALLLLGIAFFVAPPKRSMRELWRLQQVSGRLPFDFFDASSLSATLLNMALLGLIGYSYVLIIGAPVNGPVVGALLTLMGFGGFGKTVRNSVPVMAGVVFATLLIGKSPTESGPLLATFFSTTLAPLAGHFGPIIGVAAGMVHLIMVEVTGSWHGGLDLYNNGFAGGLTATLFIAILQWYQSNRAKEDFT